MDLDLAFRNTTFNVDAVPEAGLPEAVALRADRKHLAWDAYLKRIGVTTWACITAYNPNATEQPLEANEAAQRRLESAVAGLGLPFLRGRGQGDSVFGEWPPEPSLFVLGIRRRDAVALGRLFGQRAIIWAARGEPAQLIYTLHGKPPVLRWLLQVEEAADTPIDLSGFLPSMHYDMKATPGRRRAVRQENQRMLHDLLAAVEAVLADEHFAARLAERVFRRGVAPLPERVNIEIVVRNWWADVTVCAQTPQAVTGRFSVKVLRRRQSQSPPHFTDTLVAWLAAAWELRFLPPPEPPPPAKPRPEPRRSRRTKNGPPPPRVAGGIRHWPSNGPEE